MFGALSCPHLYRFVFFSRFFLSQYSRIVQEYPHIRCSDKQWMWRCGDGGGGGGSQASQHIIEAEMGRGQSSTQHTGKKKNSKTINYFYSRCSQERVREFTVMLEFFSQAERSSTRTITGGNWNELLFVVWRSHDCSENNNDVKVRSFSFERYMHDDVNGKFIEYWVSEQNFRWLVDWTLIRPRILKFLENVRRGRFWMSLEYWLKQASPFLVQFRRNKIS